MTVTAAIIVAATIFGGQPACGVPGYEVVPSITAEGPAVEGGVAVARADEERCVIQLTPAWKELGPAHRCHIVVHEIGHLHGLDHTEDEKSVMYPTFSFWEGPIAECRRLARGFKHVYAFSSERRRYEIRYGPSALGPS